MTADYQRARLELHLTTLDPVESTFPVSAPVAFRAAGVTVVRVQDESDPGATRLSAAGVDWRPAGSSAIEIRFISGLEPGRPYRIWLEVTGE